MKITKIERLHADGGWRTLDFLKISTDEGIVGWSEYNESFGGLGVSSIIDNLAPLLIGKDPRPYEAHIAFMYAVRRQASGGAIAQAIGAIENALLDIKAKSLGIPVYEMLGGPGSDLLVATGGAARIFGGHGNDVIDGGNGTDFLYESADTNFTLSATQLVSAGTGTETLTNIERVALVEIGRAHV